MPRCSSCGAKYDEEDVKNECYIIAGSYDSSIMDGLCRDCAIDAWDAEHETDSWDEFDELSDEEVSERGREAFYDRLNSDKEFRRKFF